MMQFTCCEGAYLIKSHGNGWAYEVVDRATGASLWFQDDDAHQFRDYTGDFESAERIRDYFDLLED